MVRPALARAPALGLLLGLSLGLAACGPTRPAAQVGVGAGVDGAARPASGGQTRSLDLSVGTGGAAGSVRIGDSPVRGDFGRNGWRLSI